ncbi:MAG: rRNA maturation RNase YbeY [Acidobacteria bacterium]|nr:rRNA maturation RNase YbeY [Acidobacteriota bacterium]
MPDGDSYILYRRSSLRSGRPAREAFARELSNKVAGGGEFLCLLTDDRELRRLNRRFRGKDEPTDVLSFPEPGSLGEIAISVGRARQQAAAFGHDVETEIRILILHGLLHLLGYDHENDRGRMARAEARWRAAFHLPSGLIERTQRGKS